MNRSIRSLCLAAWTALPCAYAVETTQVDLSLEDLMNLKIEVGTLTGMARNKIPVSLTTITAEDIALTPARNINDLIEVYVPGAFWMGHSESGHTGIRGVISDRNGKFLMLVNGYQMGQETHDGAMSELENWDLSEVDRIEVIRGPGSVTYGPGAIMGVVNLVTKTAATSGGLKIGAQSNLTYKSYGGGVSFGKTVGDLSFYGYGSVVATEGAKTPIWVVPDSVYGYAGDDWSQKALDLKAMSNGVSRAGSSSSYGGNPSLNFADYRGWPQGKLMLDAKYKEFRMMARYTNSGSAQLLTLNPSQLTIDGEKQSVNMIQNRQILTAIENDHAFSPTLRQVSKVSYNDQDFARWFPRDTMNADIVRNYSHAFSEKHLSFQTLTQYSLSDNHKFALGGEYVLNHTGAPWFQDAEAMRFGDNQNIFGGDGIFGDSAFKVSRGSAVGITGTPSGTTKSPYFVGDGIYTHTFSVFGEANLNFHKLATFLVSGRADKNTLAEWAFSPRVAWIAELNEQNIVKLIAQQSVRKNYLESAYLEHRKYGTLAKPEELRGLEAIWNYAPRQDLTFATSGYYNDYEVLGYNRYDSATKVLGNLKLAGLEVEGKYSISSLTLGANHSYLKQIEYKLPEDNPLVKSSGISYSDIRFPAVVSYTRSSDKKRINDTIMLSGVGNDLNNWANNSTKIFANWKVIPTVTLHVDARIFWNFQGARDGIEVFERALDQLAAKDTSADIKLYVSRVRDVIAAEKSHDAYMADARLNAAISWAFMPGSSLTVYSQNLVGLNDNKRYGYDAPNPSGLFPARFTWQEEPRTFGAKVEVGL